MFVSEIDDQNTLNESLSLLKSNSLISDILYLQKHGKLLYFFKSLLSLVTLSSRWSVI